MLRIDLQSVYGVEIPSSVKIKIDLDTYLFNRKTGKEKEQLPQRSVSKDLIQEVTEYLVNHHPKELQESFGNQAKKEKLRKIIAEYISRNTISSIKGFTLDELTQDLVNSISGLDKFDTILAENDGNMTDIVFNGTDIRIKDNKKGVYKSKIRITSDEVEAIAKKIANTTGKVWNYAKPELDTELPNLRINAIHPDISPYGTTMAIRIFSDELKINEDSFVREVGNQDILNLLKALIKAKARIIITGDTGSGKTELLKFLVGYVPNSHRINMLEDTLETNLKKLYPLKDIIVWRTRNSETDPSINVSFSRLIRSCLRSNPDWIMISETRGGEAYDMLKAASTGHSIFTTAHSKSARQAPNRIVMMCQEQVDYRSEVLGKLATSSLDIGIHVELDEKTMTRRIVEFVEYVDFENDTAIVNPLFGLVVEDIKKEINKNGEIIYTPVKKHRRLGKVSTELAEQMLNAGAIGAEHIKFLPEDWLKEKGLMNKVEVIA
jgi:pilus assembly protein CpaF